MAKARLEAITVNNGADAANFRKDLLNIARTTLSSKILTNDKDHFAELAVDAVMRLKGKHTLEAINIIKKAGGTLKVRSPLMELGFALTEGERVSRDPLCTSLLPSPLLGPSVYGAGEGGVRISIG